MEAYSEFASVYDLFMEDTPYEAWHDFIKEKVKALKVEVNKVCELGCGTGQMTMLFAKEGKEVIGIDCSPEMLMVAQDHAYEEGLSIFYSMQDMAEFELKDEMDLICSCCDSLNYLTEPEEIQNTFKQVSRYLVSGGLFIFDMNTAYKYKETLGSQIFADQTEDAAYIWENFYDEEEEINEYEVSFFIKGEDGKYERTIENHYQKAYSIEAIKEMLRKANLECMEVYDNYTNNKASETSERVTYVVRKPED